MRLRVVDSALAIARLEPGAPIPVWASLDPALTCIARTASELSIVCAEERVPEDVRCDRGWRALVVEGPLSLTLTGVLAALARPLAEAGIVIFALSTFDTDYVLVRQADLERAIATLSAAGHELAETY
jgi:uncharacterized protein